MFERYAKAIVTSALVLSLGVLSGCRTTAKAAPPPERGPAHRTRMQEGKKGLLTSHGQPAAPDRPRLTI